MGSKPSQADHDAAWELWLASGYDGNVARVRKLVECTWELAQRRLRAELAAAFRACELGERQNAANHATGTQNRALHIGARGAYGWAATLVESEGER